MRCKSAATAITVSACFMFYQHKMFLYLNLAFTYKKHKSGCLPYCEPQ